MICIEATNLGRKYGEIWGLREANFNIKSGELVVLAGPNGAGKTTTIRILTTFLKPSKGEAKVLGYDVVKEYKVIRKKIAYLPQEYSVRRDLTPMEAIMWNLVARGWSLREAKNQAIRWLKLLGLWNLRNKVCWNLSGGERHRVAVAMTLATEADVIFLDEPTTGLDVEIKRQVWKIIREVVSSGVTILMTTHDLNEAEIIADRVILISKGVTFTEASPSELVASVPYEYKVVVRKHKDLSEDYLDNRRVVDLGDRLVIYTNTRQEAIALADELSSITSIYLIDRVRLDDAYLYLISKAGGDENVTSF